MMTTLDKLYGTIQKFTSRNELVEGTTDILHSHSQSQFFDFVPIINKI